MRNKTHYHRYDAIHNLLLRSKDSGGKTVKEIDEFLKEETDFKKIGRRQIGNILQAMLSDPEIDVRREGAGYRDRYKASRHN